jgi:hypothetical protein
MTDFPASRLPASPSLEQLRRQAKELLRAHRDGDGEAVRRFRAVASRAAGLADAQFVIAREYGFENWPALKHHLEVERPNSIERYEALARDLVAAYQGDAPAAARLSSTFRVEATVDRIRDSVPKRLEALRGASSANSNLAIEDARLLIARQYGFDNWAGLVAAAAATVQSSQSKTRAPRPDALCHSIDQDEDTIVLRAPLTERDWDTVFEVVKELELTAFRAGGQMTDAVAVRLGELPHLTQLDLSGSRALTDAGVRCLAKLPALIEVNLAGSGVTDNGLEVFRELPGIRTMRLGHHTTVSDRGIANLRSCERLEFVDLMGTPTGDGAIEALTAKPNLCRFYAGNLVSDQGLLQFHDFPAFKTWAGGDVHFELDAFDAFPTYLFLNMKTRFSNAGLANLAGLEGLFAVNFFATTGSHAFDDAGSRVTAAGVASLAGLSHLGWLGCCARLGNDATMREVAAMARVRMLFGQDMVAGDDGFAALVRSPTIEYINGRRTPNLGTLGFSALAEMPVLRGLSMSCRNVSDEGFAALPGFPALTECGLSDVPDESYRHVGRCARLEWIRFGLENTDAATAHIQGLSTLKRVEIHGTHVTDRTLEILAAMPSLEGIGLHGCRGVTSIGLALLGELPRLRELEINLPRVTRDSLPAFPGRVRVRYRVN